MNPPAENDGQHQETVDLPDEAAAGRFAAGLAMLLAPGDLICLSGDLGTGKTTLARALIRALAGDAGMEVPSPTFTLVQDYPLPGLHLTHMDLYRLEDPEEIEELGLDEALTAGAVIIEWPEHAAGRLPAGGLRIRLEEAGDGRIAHLSCLDGNWQDRLARARAIDAFLASAGWAEAQRLRLPGDASARRYERLLDPAGVKSALLMDSPAMPDGPPVRNGLPYSRIAHLAEDIRAVEAVNTGLCDMGLSAPEILAIDRDEGLAIIEDFGINSFSRLFDDEAAIDQAMRAAIELLADMAVMDWPASLTLKNGEVYRVPPYDMDALLIETELCLDWYAPQIGESDVGPDVREQFISLWRDALSPVLEIPAVWVLRDFHVDNLYWLPERQGNRRVGLIDTQDCVLGHPAYDLASLLQDVRVNIPRDMSQGLFDAYVAARQARKPDFDRQSFATSYAILGAQRATKILGIFARLNARDGKPGYLRFLPRTADVLENNLKHPVLAGVNDWFATHLPQVFSGRSGQ
jgi:tRNA threonylcarbamoyl adenosine modification protein YjeE